MSELKDYSILDIEAIDDERLENSESGRIYETRVYIKSEVDKVIADLEESHKKEVEQLLMTILELKEKLAAPQLVTRLNTPEALFSNLDTMGRLKHEIDVVTRRERHHKYKRCLAMAKWCEYFANYWECCEPPDCIAFITRAKFHRKWHKRWLELAEKFKEAK